MLRYPTLLLIPIASLWILAGCEETATTPVDPAPEAQAPRGQLPEQSISYRCGEQQAAARLEDGRMQLFVGGEQFLLDPTPAASGVKYQAPDDPSTFFWTKGDRALLEIRGQRYPECETVAGSTAGPGEVFTATGNEPGWKLEVSLTQITLIADYGSTRVVAPKTPPEVTGRTTRYVSTGDGRRLTVTIVQELCSDSMSGMPHPNTVVVLFDGRELKGCGGNPADLLQGPEWIVEKLNGESVTGESRGTLNFTADGSVAGRTFCNTYRGSYALTGEGVTIGRLISTEMACAPAVMQREKLLTDLLVDVRRFEVSPGGALTLYTGDGRTITGRRKQM